MATLSGAYPAFVLRIEPVFAVSPLARINRGERR